MPNNGAGCYTGQQLVTGSLINAYLTNELRQSLVNVGLIVGA